MHKPERFDPDTLFAFGSLCLPEVFAAVTGHAPPGVPATLAGYRAVLLRGVTYPGLAPAAPEARVSGVLYRGLDASTWAALDRFEGDGYQRRLDTVHDAAGRAHGAWVYHLAPGMSHTLTPVPWALDHFRAVHLAAFLETCCEVADGRRASVADPADCG